MFPINIGYLLSLNARRFPNKTALIHQGDRVSYLELNQRVNRLAHGLMELGIVKGDRIGYLFSNSPELVELYYAVQKIGAVAIPLNHRLIGREVKTLLESARSRIFVYSDHFDPQLQEVKNQLTTVEILIRCGTKAEGEYDLGDLLENNNQQEPDLSILPDEVCRIQFTGGTTGRSKGVVRSHAADFFQTVAITISGELGGPDQVMLTQSPLCHQAGLSWLNVAIGAGNTFILCDGFNPRNILEQIQTEKVTAVMILPPAIYHKIFDLPNLQDYDLSSVKIIQTSAGGTSPDIIRKLYKTFPNGEVHYGYGLSETGGVGTNFILTRDMVEQQQERARSVGREMPFVELKLVDEEDREVPTGAVGECVARGPSMMIEYYNQPELTTQVLRNGWVHTGDMLKKDEDGFFYLLDRKKDMIKSGGENVFAQEVENVLRRHPDIQDCAVIGVPDPAFGEAVMAVVKLRSGHQVTVEALQDHCKAQLASYKKPRYIKFVDAFPVDQAGKIQKFRLREMYC